MDIEKISKTGSHDLVLSEKGDTIVEKFQNFAHRHLNNPNFCLISVRNGLLLIQEHISSFDENTSVLEHELSHIVLEILTVRINESE